MKSNKFLVAITALSLVVAGVVFAQAQSAGRLPGILPLMAALNGTPTKIGTLVSAGTSISNSATATPFTVTAGAPVWFECDAISHVCSSSATCSATITNAAYGPKQDLSPAYRVYTQTNGSTAVSMIPASGSSNCAVFEMR